MAEPVGTKSRPRSSSRAIAVHVFAPPALSSEPGAQVSAPGSSGRGMLWNCHSRSPVPASKARMLPGSAPSLSEVEKPNTSRSSNTTPGAVTVIGPDSPGGMRSSRPPSPNASAGSPVAGSSAIRMRPAV